MSSLHEATENWGLLVTSSSFVLIEAASFMTALWPVSFSGLISFYFNYFIYLFIFY